MSDINLEHASYANINFIIRGIKEICKIEQQEPEKIKILVKNTKRAIKNKRIRIIKKDGMIRGFVQFTFSSKEPYGLDYGKRKRYCWVEWMYIAKSYRRKGFGRQLHKDLMKICNKNNVKEIMLDVFEVNENARNFYQKEKFKDFIHILREKV